MFADSYIEARDAFREEAEARGGQVEALEVVPSNEEGPSLTIDIAVFGDGPRTVVLSSGLHGIEGFAGSAIQRQAMADGWPKDLRVVMMHALNPYGMHHIRRVNENNVDLNRNFLEPSEAYFIEADSYRPFHPLLNPPHSPRLDFFTLRALGLLIRHGMPTLKRAIVGGQYEFPDGIFFGGTQLERGPALILEALPTLLEGTERIVHVDFHTGLGKSGTYALLVEPLADTPGFGRLADVFGEHVQPWQAGEGVAYEIRGGFPEALARIFGSRIDVLTCEFGTHHEVTVLKALRLENQAHHHGGSTKSAKAALRHAFYPDSPAWREDILRGGRTVVNQAAKAALA